MSASLAPTQPQTPTPEPVVTPGIVVKTSEAAPVEAPPSPRASKAGRADGARAALAPAWQVKASPAELTRIFFESSERKARGAVPPPLEKMLEARHVAMIEMSDERARQAAAHEVPAAPRAHLAVGDRKWAGRAAGGVGVGAAAVAEMAAARRRAGASAALNFR